MRIISGNYSRKTFENLKKYLVSSYPTQPMVLSIVSDYCLVSSEDGTKSSTAYHVLEISKKDGIKLRLLEDEHTIGGWDKIESILLQGRDYEWLIIGTKKFTIKIFRSDLMDSNKQLIRMFEFPKT